MILKTRFYTLFSSLIKPYSNQPNNPFFSFFRNKNRTDLVLALELAAEDGLSGGLGHSGVGVGGGEVHHGAGAEHHGEHDHAHDGVSLRKEN